MMCTMRVLILLQIFCLTICIVDSYSIGQQSDVYLTTPIYTNNIHNYFQLPESHSDVDETRFLKKVFLNNRSVTCNDGSRAGFYLRKFPSSKKWVIFLEGGWYCYDQQSCKDRWLNERYYMSSSTWPERRDVGGILSPDKEENPYWYNVNHVFVPYCTSDSWSGTKKSTPDTFSFMGSLVVQEVVKDLLLLGLENSTDLLLSGSSAGGTGVMVNLDPVRDFLHDTLNLRNIDVKGVADSGWFLDRTPYADNGKPAVDAIRKGIQLWQGKVPKRCRRVYENEPWRCYFGYRLYPTLKAPLFIFQWLFDEAQMQIDKVGVPVTMEQWDYIHEMGDELRKSFLNVTALFAPSCIAHSVLTKRDWLSVTIDEISFADSLFCWENRYCKRRRKKNASVMFSDEPSLVRRQLKRNSGNKHNKKIEEIKNNKKNKNNKNKNKNRRKKKNRQRNGKNKKRKGCRVKGGEFCGNGTRHRASQESKAIEQMRQQRSVLRTQKRTNSYGCRKLRRLEKCSWPQCNHSCPKLHNPYTGDEMSFMELLQSFGMDMRNVASALGITVPALRNMDQKELITLLTQRES